MHTKENPTWYPTKEDQELAAASRPGQTVINPDLSREELNAAVADRSGRVTIADGTSISIREKQPALSINLGPNDPREAVLQTSLQQMQHQANRIVDQMRLLVDPVTGEPLPQNLADYNRLALQLRTLDSAAEFERQRAYAQPDPRDDGIAQLQREAQWRQMQNDSAAALEREFGKIRIV